jgi:AcrR family transcriptional regulator
VSSPKRNTRSYRQVARAEAAAETRRHIIEVTRAALARAPLVNVGLPEIAAEAGVARSTIYTAFGSREGLMFALAEDLLKRSGFDRVGAAFRLPDAVEALQQSLREAAQVYASEAPVARALLRLAAIDKDAARGAARIEYGRREGMASLAGRLAAQGALRDDVTPEEAADVLWVITSFDTFDQLYDGRGLAADVVAERLVTMVRRTLLRVP